MKQILIHVTWLALMEMLDMMLMVAMSAFGMATGKFLQRQLIKLKVLLLPKLISGHFPVQKFHSPLIVKREHV